MLDQAFPITRCTRLASLDLPTLLETGRVFPRFDDMRILHLHICFLCDYIYIYTSENEDRTCIFKLEDAKAVNDEIQKYYNAVQYKLMGLNSKLKGYDLFCTNSLQILHKNITNGQVINFFQQDVMMKNLTNSIKYIKIQK